MRNEDGTVWLVCNGEIYNYPALRQELEGKGHVFLSHSDNEAVIHAYEQWGEEAVNHLEGMFAFALWDEKNEKLLAARDRVGIKPLYYSGAGDSLALASSAGALLRLMDEKHEPDPVSVAYVMTLGYVPSPWSIWRGINKLEPGNLLVWRKNSGIRIRSYWAPPREIKQSANNDGERWRELFEGVLREHLLADVPLGLFLSGGIDSSSIAAGLKEINYPLEALTVTYPGAKSDEAPIAKATAARLGLPHRLAPLAVEDVNFLAREVARVYDEPQGYSALLSMFMISRYAARDYKVVLAGDGGDEVFGGYTWYSNLDERATFNPSLFAHFLRRIRPSRGSQGASQRASLFSKRSSLHRHAWRLFPRFLPEEAELLMKPMKLNFGDDEMLAPLKKHYEPALPLKRALQRVDIMTFCSDSILAKVDRASMAHSLEVRVPFLDRRIIEEYIAAPLSSRENIESKPLLRTYLSSRVPAEVLSAPKQGFSLQALDNFDWGSALEEIAHGPWVKAGYWSPDWRQCIESDMPYRNGRIWTLLMLTRWAEAWLQ
jgi:asparagine synthase (glutamine-hydrolysing)